MMKVLQIGLSSILVSLSGSCEKIIYNALLNKEVNEQKYVHSAEGKEIIYIPMVHIGFKSFYEDVANKVDSLQRMGYAFFYESGKPSLTDSVETDLLNRKLRKIYGINVRFSGTERIDTVNHLILGEIPYPEDLDLTMQPPYSVLNLDKGKAQRADVPMNQLLDSFEARYGAIELTSCDWETPLDSTYECTPLGKEKKDAFGDEFIRSYRDSVLVYHVLRAKEDKIAIIYGAGHEEPFLKKLQQHDPEWKKVTP